jgi:hypothetical protein
MMARIFSWGTDHANATSYLKWWDNCNPLSLLYPSS